MIKYPISYITQKTSLIELRNYKTYLKGLFGLTNIIINNRSSLTIIFRKLAETSGYYIIGLKITRI